MGVVPNRDVGEFLGIGGYGAVYATAAGAGDDTKITGATINRGTYGMPESGLLVVQYMTSLTASQTLDIDTIKIQESADGSTWDTAETLVSPGTVKTGALTDSEDHYSVKVKLSDRKQYIRFLVHPDLSHSATDTAVLTFCLVYGPGRDTALLDAPDATDE